MTQQQTISRAVEELYNKNPYRYRPIGSKENTGLKELEQALTSVYEEGEKVGKESS